MRENERPSEHYDGENVKEKNIQDFQKEAIKDDHQIKRKKLYKSNQIKDLLMWTYIIMQINIPL